MIKDPPIAKLPTKWFIIVVSVILVVGGSLALLVKNGYVPFVRYTGIVINDTTKQCSSYEHWFWLHHEDMKLPTSSEAWVAYANPASSVLKLPLNIPGARDCTESYLQQCCTAIGYSFVDQIE